MSFFKGAIRFKRNCISFPSCSPPGTTRPSVGCAVDHAARNAEAAHKDTLTCDTTLMLTCSEMFGFSSCPSAMTPCSKSASVVKNGQLDEYTQSVAAVWFRPEAAQMLNRVLSAKAQHGCTCSFQGYLQALASPPSVAQVATKECLATLAAHDLLQEWR